MNRYKKSQRGIGAREASGGETYLDVLEVNEDDTGLVVSVRVYTEALLGCSAATVSVRSAGGQELAAREVAMESAYPFFGLVSIETPCVGRARIRLPKTSMSDRIQFSVDFDGETYATGAAYRVDDLAKVPPPPETPNGGPLSSAVSSAVQPLVSGALTLGAGYFILTNFDSITDLLD